MLPWSFDPSGIGTMAEAKDIDDSLEFLRSFEKNVQTSDIASLVQEKLSIDKKKLDLRGVAIKAEEFKILSEMDHLHALQQLNLNQTGLTSAGLQPLCGSRIFSELEFLSMSNNNLDDEAIFFFSKSPHTLKLAELNLSGNEIGALGARVLSLSASLTGLVTLDLSYNRIEPLSALN